VKGHTQLIAMRLSGWRPAWAWVNVDEDAARAWVDWHQWTPDLAELLVEPDDVPELLDMRPLVGIKVGVMGPNEARVRKVAKACQEAGAVVLAAVGYYPLTHREFGACALDLGPL
jgi:hypothetical protein